MSERVSDWFDEWAVDHFARNERFEVPDPMAPEGHRDYEDLEREFGHAGVTRAAADRASERYVAQFTSPLRHVQVVLKLARECQRDLAEMAAAPGSFEEARRAGLGCEDCGGTGLATRYRHRSVPGRDAKGRPLSPTIQLYCTCKMGRWVERCHREAGERPFADLADHPWLQLGPVSWSGLPDNPHRWPPSAWDFENHRPIPAAGPARDETPAATPATTRAAVDEPPF